MGKSDEILGAELLHVHLPSSWPSSVSIFKETMLLFLVDDCM